VAAGSFKDTLRASAISILANHQDWSTPEPKKGASGSVLPSPVGSKLWLLLPPETADEARAELMERPLLPAEHLQLTGMPMYPEFAGDTYQYSWLLVLTHDCLYLLLVASGYLLVATCD
jgi:hypothetical protein